MFLGSCLLVWVRGVGFFNAGTVIGVSFLILCCVMFGFLCPTFLKFLLCSPRWATSVCCIVPFMFSHVLLPFVTTPGLLPPLSPHLLFVWSLVSVFLVSAFPLVLVRSLYLSAHLLLLLSVSSLFLMVCVFGFWVLLFAFDLNFAFWFVLLLAFVFSLILPPV